ncbi:MAG: hypothetical protein AAGF24_11980, partial [Cyanobacteria bacterium P01_H01_bin.121]
QAWTLEFSQFVLNQLITVIKTKNRQAYNLASMLRKLRSTFHPQLASEVTTTIQNFPRDSSALPYWQGNLSELQDYLSFRQEFWRSLQAN